MVSSRAYDQLLLLKRSFHKLFSNLVLSHSTSIVKSSGILRFPKILNFVFFILRDNLRYNLFKSNHNLSLANSSETIFNKCWRFSPSQNIFVSSAKMTNFNKSEVLTITFMYNINNFGPDLTQRLQISHNVIQHKLVHLLLGNEGNSRSFTKCSELNLGGCAWRRSSLR